MWPASALVPAGEVFSGRQHSSCRDAPPLSSALRCSLFFWPHHSVQTVHHTRLFVVRERTKVPERCWELKRGRFTRKLLGLSHARLSRRDVTRTFAAVARWDSCGLLQRVHATAVGRVRH